MIQINRAFEAVLNKHYVCPKGVIGRLVGELMVRQHEKETAWTVSMGYGKDSFLEQPYAPFKLLKIAFAS